MHSTHDVCSPFCLFPPTGWEERLRTNIKSSTPGRDRSITLQRSKLWISPNMQRSCWEGTRDNLIFELEFVDRKFGRSHIGVDISQS